MSTRHITELKAEYVEYYTDVPIQRYASMAIGKNEDTIIRWRNQDSVFAEAVEKAKSEWVRKKLLVSKAEFALERLEKDIFSQRATVELNHTLDFKPNIQLAEAFNKFIEKRTRA